MSDMPSVTFDTPEALYEHLRPKESDLIVAQIRPLTAWMTAMKDFTNPNACACRKGAKAKESLTLQMYRLPDSLTNEHKETIRNIMGTHISLLIEGQKTAMLA
jgi:hypothetical protein